MPFPRSFQAPPGVKSQLFTATGLWYPDPTATWVYVEGVGGGASPTSSSSSASAGAAGGVFDWALLPANLITGPVQVVIGAGGPGVINAPGTVGGDTKFGNFLTCKGGGNGFNYEGAGGGATGSFGTPGGNAVRGGAGGGGCGSTSASAGGVSLRGGNGGAGINSGQAGNGAAPGGGGGASYSGTPGSGARGQMIVYWW